MQWDCTAPRDSLVPVPCRGKCSLYAVSSTLHGWAKDSKENVFLGWQMISRMKENREGSLKGDSKLSWGHTHTHKKKKSTWHLKTARGTGIPLVRYSYLNITRRLWSETSLSELRKYTKRYIYPLDYCKCQKNAMLICTTLIYVDVTKLGEFRLTFHHFWIKQVSEESKTEVANCL